MVRTIEQMVAKGKRKLAKKLPGMPGNYRDAVPRAKANYGDMPFGPKTKAAYAEGMDTAADSYADVVRPGLEETWATRWSRKIRE